MLQPTDRVIAKVLLRVIKKLTTDRGGSPLEAAFVLSAYTQNIVGNNPPVIKAIGALLREATEEDRAESEGRAYSTMGTPNYSSGTPGTDL